MSLDQLSKLNLPLPDQMFTLIKFVTAGSISAAFGQGKSAQSAATQKLNRIDKSLGIKTRKESGSYKVPTDEAEELANYCREFFQHIDDFKNRAERKPNNFVIGAGDSLVFYHLIPALKLTGEWKKGVELHLQNLRSKEIIAGVLNGSVDMGLVRGTAIDQKVLNRRVLKMEKIAHLDYAFYVNRDLLKPFKGDFKNEKELGSWCLKNLSLATFWSEQSAFNTALSKSKLKLTSCLRCESFPQVKQAVTVGGYCGILPVSAFGDSPPSDIYCFGRKLLSLASRDIVLIWSAALTERRQGGDAALQELRKALKS